MNRTVPRVKDLFWLAVVAAWTAGAPSHAHAQSTKVYVTNQSFNQVHVIRLSDQVTEAVIPVGSQPTGIAIPSVGGFGYVANRGDNTVTRIDLATNTATNTFAIPGNPTSVAIIPDGTKAYVVQSTECEVLVDPTPTPGPTPTPDPTPTPEEVRVCYVAAIDTATDTVIANIAVGEDPFAVATAQSGGFVYVTNRTDDTLSVIDTTTDTVVATVPVGQTPEGIAVGGGEIYVANDAANTVTVIRELDLQIVGTSITGAGPLGVAVAPDGVLGAVSNDQDSSVTIFETGTLLPTLTVPVGTNPAGIVVTADSNVAVVANNTNDKISVIDMLGGTVTDIAVFGSPTEIAVTPEPRLTITKVLTPSPAPAGGGATFEIAYGNIGNGAAFNATLVDTVPTEFLTFDSASAGGTLAAGEITWAIGTIPAGGAGVVSADFLVDAIVPQGSSTSNTAVISEPDFLQTAESLISVPIASFPQYDITASAPDPVQAGGQVTYTVTYSNIGTSDALATEMLVTYDPNVTFVSANPPPAVDDDTWAIGDLAIGAGGTITITVDVGAPLPNGSLIATDFRFSDAFGNPTKATAVNTIQSAPALSLSITDIPDPAQAGGTVLYDVIYGNPGTDTGTNIVVTLNYDIGVTYLSSDVAPDLGFDNQWTVPTLAGGETGRIQVQVQMPPQIPNGTIMSTLGNVVNDEGDAAAATVSTTVQSAPQLALVKTDSPDPVLSGDQITYTLTYSNVGSDEATGVVVTETYPAEVAFVSALPAPDALTDNQWTIGTVPAGGSGQIVVTVDATAPNGSVADNLAVIVDSAGNNANAQESTVIDMIPALTAGIAGSPSPIGPGGLLTYTVSYGNTGTDAAAGVVASVSYPAGVSFVSSMPAPDAGTDNVWTIGALPIGGSGNITIQTTVSLGVADGTPLVADLTVADSMANSVQTSDIVLVEASPSLVLAVNRAPDPVLSGGNVTYTVIYGNQGTADAEDVILSQVFDPRLTFLGSTPAATVPATSWDLGTVAPGQGGTVSIQLQTAGGLADGEILTSQARLDSSNSGFSTAAELTTIGPPPVLDVTLTVAQALTGPAATINATLDYANNSLVTLPATVLTLDTGGGAIFSGSTVAPDDPAGVTWNLGDLNPGQTGSISVDLLSTAPAGGILSLLATIASGVVSDSDSSQLVSVGVSDLGIGRSQYRVRPPGAAGVGKSLIRLRSVIGSELPIQFPSGLPFDGTQPVTVIISTPTQTLYTLSIPGGLLVPRKSGWKYVGADPATGEGKITLLIRPRGKNNEWRLRLKAKKLDLAIADTANLQISLALGSAGLSAERPFVDKSRARPGSQRLKYNGDPDI